MSLADSLERAKAMLNEIKRNNKFRKANQKREDAIELQYAMAKCRGQLEICYKDFNRAIKNQSANIRVGRSTHQDTMVQEQVLWDAAIGYMLVRDAIYSVKTVSTYDSVSHAYDMLDAAMRQITGKKPGLLERFRREKPERSEFGYLNSKSALKDKEALLNGVFEELIETGDIEACMDKATHPEERAAARRNLRDDASDNRRYADLINSLDDDDDRSQIDTAALDNMMDIHPPKE